MMEQTAISVKLTADTTLLPPPPTHTDTNCVPIHSIILGPPGSGKRSIVRLAASMVNTRIVEFQCRTPRGTQDLRECLRLVFTGSAFRKTLLLVDDSQLSTEEQLSFLCVCRVMEGTMAL